ncbi:DUF1697 domain-containing protein [Actinotalea sp.]|uniref:DUF1697 domain-containing protein n=1 Tax=Actinotalea sp. TaxID=1872145 RepID=UPI003569C764
MRYAVFLRGVNVGGRTIRMAELRAALGTLAVSELRTLLASGNVVCRSELDAVALRSAVEGVLREEFGYEAWVVVLEAERLAALLAACPFPADSDQEHTYLTFTSDPAVLDALDAAVVAVEPEAPMRRLGPEATAWTVPRGATLASARATLSGRARFAPSVTDRNLRTVLKVASALDDLASAEGDARHTTG